ncbi:MAG TPA: T9SS type A sorting domain-containing protein, partial [Ignavibacteria bacterium]|nr:T9SS type A sorting domain-containing protein [Ignavibacteria bacterium]
GESWGNDNLNGDYLTVKYNSNGVVQWAKRYNGPSCKNDKALSIGLDAMNNVYVTGASEQQGKGYDYVTVKYSTNGSQQWAARYDGPAYLNDIANELKVDGMGNVYVTGSSHGGTSKLDYTTIKYNSAGQQQWLKRYTNSPINDTDVATGIDIDVYGNAYVTGYSKSSGAASYDYVTIKYKGADGTQMWLNRADGGLSDKAWDIKVIYKTCVSSQGSLGGGNDIPCWDVFVYVSGESKLGSGTDFLTYGYGENGNQRWFNRFNGPQNGNDAAYSISVKANYPVIYAGGVFANDYGVIGIIELTRNGSSDFKGLSSNYPNPFNPSTNISYNITKESSVRINVFDILGRNVAKLVDEKKPEGTYSVTFDASDLNSGIYFYRIETEYASETKKIVLIK